MTGWQVHDSPQQHVYLMPGSSPRASSLSVACSPASTHIPTPALTLPLSCLQGFVVLKFI